jgi:uncharacterized phage-associated protein
MSNRKDFCTACRKESEYTLRKRSIQRVIKGKEYTFNITIAVCNECGEEMGIPGLIDRNIQEVDEQYRACEGIVSVDDIEKLMTLYRIGKAPLSLALGFGEITITRYLCGQMPSKEYSDIMKKAMSSPLYMKTRLQENRGKLAPAAYKKAMSAVTQLENLFSVSDQMLSVISYMFESMKEITPLMLQKLLYFIQGVSCALNGRPMFRENCQAWVHGPVYPEVYDIFRDFKYNPIEDVRFTLLECASEELAPEDCQVVDLVINSFGEYSGKVLERITHEELPWEHARSGMEDDIPSNEIISIESIAAYYSEKHREYDFRTEAGLRRYIRDIRSKRRDMKE